MKRTILPAIVGLALASSPLHADETKTNPAAKDLSAAPSPTPTGAEGGGDWPTWGVDGTRNMVSPAKGIPFDFEPGDIGEDGKVIDAKGLKWATEMGSQSYGTTTVKDGRIFIGTNNEEPRDPAIKGDHSIVMCFDEKSGEFLWQLAVPKLDAGKVNDWEYLGICSSVVVDGKYGYVVTNRCELLCLDVYGLSDGNDGPFTEEGKYLAGGLEKVDSVEALPLAEKSADIVWGYDMRTELGVFPHNVTSSTIVLTDKHVWVSTSNGVDWSHINIPNPNAPTFVAIDRETGELAAEEAEGISERTMHCNWSSPTYGKIAGKETVIFGGGDGIVYGFDAVEFTAEKDGDEEYNLMNALWKVDCCPKEYRFDDKGEPIKYATYPGPSEIIASPVIYNDKVYVVIGQDPEHGEGVGAFTCIDPSKGDGDAAIVWQFKEIGRSISTPSIHDGLVYVGDYSGRIFCLDAETGEKYWEHDTLSHIWSSTMFVDGKVLLGNEDGELVILKAGKEYEEPAAINFPSPIYSTCVVANGTLYVMTQTHLYAFGKP
jgi:outer membrane protein assembly factor BamB